MTVTPQRPHALSACIAYTLQNVGCSLTWTESVWQWVHEQTIHLRSEESIIASYVACDRCVLCTPNDVAFAINQRHSNEGILNSLQDICVWHAIKLSALCVLHTLPL